MARPIHLLVLVGLAALLIGQPCLAQGGAPAGGRPLNADEVAIVKKAIEILKAKAEFLKTEGDAEFQKRFENAVRAFESVFNQKVGDKEHGAVSTGPAEGGGEAGATDGSGPVIGADGDVNEANLAARWVQIGNKLFEPTAIEKRLKLADLECSEQFIVLLLTIVHEGVHMNQEDVDLPATIEEATRAVSESPEAAADLLDRKLKAIQQEVECYETEARLADQIVAALSNLMRNGAPDAWAAHWEKCKTATNADGVDLWPLISGVLHGRASAEALAKDRTVVGLTGTSKNNRPPDTPPNGLQVLIDEMRAAGKSDAEIAVELNKVAAYRHSIIGVGGERKRRANIDFDDRSELVHIFFLDTREGFFIGTGIPHPQDVELIEDASGAFKLVVCGLGDPADPLGVVRVLDMPPVAEPGPAPIPIPIPIPVPPPAPLFEPFGSLAHCDICVRNPFLVAPTSIMVAPDGRVYVWDVEATALYLLPDDNGDRVPDRIDLTTRVRMPRRFAPIARHLASAEWIGDQPILNWRIGEPYHAGNALIFLFRDANHDGFFESVVPSTWNRLRGVRDDDEDEEDDDRRDRRRGHNDSDD